MGSTADPAGSAAVLGPTSRRHRSCGGTTPRPEPTRRGLIELTRTAEYYGQLQRVLRKVDLASMHHSLEVRVPALSREVVELSAVDGRRGLPPERGAQGAVARPARPEDPRGGPTDPQEGFTPPLDRWIDGPLDERVRDQASAVRWHLDPWLDSRTVR